MTPKPLLLAIKNRPLNLLSLSRLSKSSNLTYNTDKQQGEVMNAHEQDKKNITFGGNFWIDRDSQVFLASARIELLEKIHSGNSIAEAARQLGVGYKTAWDMLNSMNHLSDEPLVISTKGGHRGGGTVVTENGQKMIRTFRMIESEYQMMLMALEQRFPELSQWHKMRQRLPLRTSARNQLFCRIQSLEKQGHRIMVTLDLGGKQYLRAMLTQNSIDEMGISVGQQVIALMKAPTVTLGLTGKENQYRLEGVLQSVDIDEAGGAEVEILLTSGQTVIAILDEANAVPSQGSRVYANVDPKQVILATF